MSPASRRASGATRRRLLVTCATLGILAHAACGAASGPPRSSPPRPATAGGGHALGSLDAPTLARAARGPAISAQEIRGSLEIFDAPGAAAVWSTGSLHLLVARSGAVRLQAEDLLLVSDGARMECRGPSGRIESGSPWRRPAADAEGPCGRLSPGDLSRALLPRDPRPGRAGSRLVVVHDLRGPALLELAPAGEGRNHVTRRFLFTRDGSSLRAREWLDGQGRVSLRAEYVTDEAGARQVVVSYPESGLSLRIVVTGAVAEPSMTPGDFALPLTPGSDAASSQRDPSAARAASPSVPSRLAACAG